MSRRTTQIGNKLSAVLGNLAMWAGFLLAVAFGGWALQSLIGSVTQ